MNRFSKWFWDKSIRFKIISVYLISLTFIGSLGYLYYVYSDIKATNQEIESYRSQVIKDRRQMVINMVNAAIDGISNYYKDYKNGTITEDISKHKAVDFVNSIRYNIGESSGDYNYIWINRKDGLMVLDPPKPELNGKNVLDFKDKNGVYLFRDMIRIANLKGSGFVHYCWPKLNEPKDICFPKTSYVRYFYPWKWVVGSGFYMDDIDKEIKNYISKKRKKLINTVLLSILFGAIASLLSSIMFYFIVYTITEQLKKIGSLSKRLANEDISPKLKLPYSFNDETGYLVKNFNIFIDENYKLDLFKKTIEEDRDLDSVYKRIGWFLKNEFGFKEFSIYEVNNSKNALRQIVSSGSRSFCKQDILVDSSLCRAVRTGKDVDSFKEKNVCLSFTRSSDREHICIPLITGYGVVFVLQILFDKQEKGRDIEIQINRVKRFLREATPVIETKRLLGQLEESTMRDPMTGLYNRRFLDEFATTFSSTVKRRNTNAGILMCDIDFFKQVNDVYGHNAGDEVLKGVVGSIKKMIRESDIAVRFGGEEFVILLQDVDENLVTEIAERIRHDVEISEFTVAGNIIKKTISIGISIFPKDSDNLWKCIKYSDVAMYKAKTTGRNKVVRFEQSMWKDEEY